MVKNTRKKTRKEFISIYTDTNFNWNKITYKAQITELRRYLDKVKYEWFSKTKYLLILGYLIVKGTARV